MEGDRSADDGDAAEAWKATGEEMVEAVEAEIFTWKRMDGRNRSSKSSSKSGGNKSSTSELAWYGTCRQRSDGREAAV